MSIEVCDSIVEEYLIHRGFTKTFKSLQREKKDDRTQNFDATRIVDQIFVYIATYDIESFVNLWFGSSTQLRAALIPSSSASLIGIF
jgi:hypothetical protein